MDKLWTGDDEELALSCLSARDLKVMSEELRWRVPLMLGPEFLFFRHIVCRILERAREGELDESRIFHWGYGGELGWMTRRFPEQAGWRWHATVVEHRIDARHQIRPHVRANVGVPLAFIHRSNGTFNEAEIRHYIEWPVRFEQSYDLVVISPYSLAPDQTVQQLPRILNEGGVAMMLRGRGVPPGPDFEELQAWELPGTRWLVYTKGPHDLVSRYAYCPAPEWLDSMTPLQWLGTERQPPPEVGEEPQEDAD